MGTALPAWALTQEAEVLESESQEFNQFCHLLAV